MTMKIYGIYLALCLVTCLSQPTFGSKVEVFYYYDSLNYSSLFSLFSDLSGGIIGDVQTGGKIQLKVYTYDQSALKKSKLIYGIETDRSRTTFGGEAWQVNVELFGNLGNQYTCSSNEIKLLAQNAIPQLQGWCPTLPWWYRKFLNISLTVGSKIKYGSPISSDCDSILKKPHPVMVELTFKNASPKKIKVPGIGEIDVSNLIVEPIIIRGSNLEVVSLSENYTFGHSKNRFKIKHMNSEIAEMKLTGLYDGDSLPGGYCKLQLNGNTRKFVAIEKNDTSSSSFKSLINISHPDLVDAFVLEKGGGTKNSIYMSCLL